MYKISSVAYLPYLCTLNNKKGKFYTIIQHEKICYRPYGQGEYKIK